MTKQEKNETNEKQAEKKPRSEKKIVSTDEAKAYERKIAQRDETIKQLQDQLEKFKADALAMAADYKSRFDSQQATCTTLEKAKEEVFEGWRKEVHDLRTTINENNSKTGELVKELRQRINALEDGLAREATVQDLTKELERARAKAASDDAVWAGKVKALLEEAEFLKTKLRKRGCDYPESKVGQ